MILKLTLSGRRALDKPVLRQSAWNLNPNWNLHPVVGVATTEIHGYPVPALGLQPTACTLLAWLLRGKTLPVKGYF